MALYTMYWPDWMCARAREAGLEGKPLRVVWGGHNQDSSVGRSRLTAGDTLVPITAIDGVVYALTKLVVAQKSTADEWLPSHPDDAVSKFGGCGHEAVIAVEGSTLPLEFTRAFTPAELTAWRYDGTAGPRPIKFLEGGRLKKPMSMQGVYRVTEPTQRLIEAVLARVAPVKPKTPVSELEAALKDSPTDEGAARVLADAWQEQGDPRGEVIALELALAKETDVTKALELDARHAALMRKAGAKKQPGGYPFRMLQGARPFETLGLLDVPLSGSTPKARLAALLTFCDRVLDEAGAETIEVMQRTLKADVQGVLDDLGAQRQSGPYNIFSRSAVFTRAELERLVQVEGALRLAIVGLLRTKDGGPKVPLQQPSQWLGSPLLSEVHCSLAAGTLTATLRAPMGSPLSAARFTELQRALADAGLTVEREQWRRNATGGNVATSNHGRKR